MKPAASVTVSGTAFRLHFEHDTEGAVIVAYLTTSDGETARVWLRLPPSSVDYLARRMT